MGYLTLALLGGAAFAALVALRVARPLWSLVGAALFLGAAGYAWQGWPLLASADAVPRVDSAPIEPEMIALRASLLGSYTQDAAYLIASDAIARSGDPRAASEVMLGAVRKLPNSFIAWTWLGTTLAGETGQVQPPALLAFRRAAQLAPDHPAPPFYAGLAYVRAGDFATARAYWRRAVALSPAGASYRREIAVRLALLERLLASGAVR
jgi:tetratricopeptide (TPR) repeat protein